jgi:hypothetical protein
LIIIDYGNVIYHHPLVFFGVLKLNSALKIFSLIANFSATPTASPLKARMLKLETAPGVFWVNLMHHNTQISDKIFFSDSCHTNLRFSKQFSRMQHIACKIYHTTSSMQLVTRNLKLICINRNVFHLPHMECEGSIGLLSRKMKIFYC